MSNFLSTLKPENWQPQLVTMLLTVLIILITSTVYRFKVAKLKPNSVPGGIVLLGEMFISWTEDLVVEIMGSRFRKFTPYIMYLFLYIGLGVIIGLLGFEATLTSYTVCFCLGLVTFSGIYVVGIFFQRWRFLKRYLQNPLDILTQIAPLISITFRIFGNLTSGTIILALIYGMFTNVSIKITDEFSINILGGIIAVPFHFYFDLFAGLIQTFVFGLLTMSYIGIEAEVEISERKLRKITASQKQYYVYPTLDLTRETVFDKKTI